jgi:pseudaminic acid cytidylyltransferase
MKMNDKIVAILPARGGSKRIPQKNIKDFLGKPIIAYSIETALKSDIFDKVIVSTDSDEIAEVAIQYGAEVPFIRPNEFSDDFTGTDEVIIHALKWLKANNGENFNYVCCIYSTAPFIQIEYLKKGLELLKKYNSTSAFSVTSYPYQILRSLKINSKGRIEMICPQYFDKRSQDLPEAYHDAGQFYWANVDKYLIEKRFFSKDSIPIVIPRYLVQDIDTLEDWELAEKLFTNNDFRQK